jgi:hypothetical protein
MRLRVQSRAKSKALIVGEFAAARGLEHGVHRRHGGVVLALVEKLIGKRWA